MPLVGPRTEVLALGTVALFLALSLSGCETPKVKQTVTHVQKNGHDHCKVVTKSAVIFFGCKDGKKDCSTATHDGSITCQQKGYTPTSRQPIELAKCEPGQFDTDEYQGVCVKGMPVSRSLLGREGRSQRVTAKEQMSERMAEDEVKKEFAQNLQIHDVFGDEEKEDVKKEKAVRADKELSQLQTKTAPDMAEEVKKEFAQNIQIHDAFSAQEKEDVKKEKAVKANKELSQLQK